MAISKINPPEIPQPLKHFILEFLKLFGIAAAYCATGKLGTLLALPPGYATPVWAPSGIALAGLLLFGYRSWPGVWLGSCLVNFSTTVHSLGPASTPEAILVVSSIGLGAAMQALFGAYLIRRYIQFPASFEEAREVIVFLLLGGPISCVVSATVGVTTLWIAGVISLTNYPLNWGTWWIGDSIGVILLAPLILLAISPEPALRTWPKKQVSVILPLAVTFFFVIIWFSKSQEYLIAHGNWRSWFMLVGGLAFAGSFWAFFLMARRRIMRIEMLIAQRTASLEASESRFRSVMQSANDAIVVADGHGDITAINKASLQMFGYAAEEKITGKPLTLLMPAYHQEANLVELERLAAGGAPQLIGKTVELFGVKKNGTEFPLELSFSTFQSDHETFCTAIMRDITERKKIDRMKTEFVSFASHQLKTPLAEIRGFAENMLTGMAEPITEKQKKYLQWIQETSVDCLRLISDLINVTKVEQGMIFCDAKTVPLIQIIDHAVKDYRDLVNNRGLKLVVETEDTKLAVEADFNKAVEAIKNVLNNAIKFTDAGTILVQTKSRGQFGIAEISDTGSGIDEALMPLLFTKELLLQDSGNAKGGSGLGLYIAKSLMKLQGGDVTAESMPGKGSKFVFTFRKIIA